MFTYELEKIWLSLPPLDGNPRVRMVEAFRSDNIMQDLSIMVSAEKGIGASVD